jgi:RNA polymerase sigma-70 factor, ECF subfamily
LREARTILRDSRADDAAQEAILRAWRHAGRCLTPRAPAAWVRAIARREALRLAGAATTPADLLCEADERPAPDRSAALESHVDVVRSMRSLNPDERRAVAYHYWLDYTQAQAATALGVPEGTMKIRLHRARRKLRTVISGPGGP